MQTDEIFNNDLKSISKIPTIPRGTKFSMCPGKASAIHKIPSRFKPSPEAGNALIRSTLAVIDNRLPYQANHNNLPNRIAGGCRPQNRNVANLKAKELVRRSLSTNYNRGGGLRGRNIQNVKASLLPSHQGTITKRQLLPDKQRAEPCFKKAKTHEPGPKKVGGTVLGPPKAPPKLSFTRNTVLTTADKMKLLVGENDKLKADVVYLNDLLATQAVELRENGIVNKALRVSIDEGGRELDILKGTASATKLALENKLAASTAERDEAVRSRDEARIKLGGFEAEVERLNLLLRKCREDLLVQEGLVEALSVRLDEAEAKRRLMHNQIQDLKGNIRVFCRVRPVLPHEAGSMGATSGPVSHFIKMGEGDDICSLGVVKNGHYPESNNAHNDTSICSSHSESSTNVATGSANHIGASNLRPQCFNFKFDRVFNQSSSQGEIFAEVSDLVQSALDGYNVCIFAYGATGSGKTYTMEGSGWKPSRDLSPDREEHRADAGLGIIPHAFSLIFDTVGRFESAPSTLAGKKHKGGAGLRYELYASFVEIYNERLRDLLAPASQQPSTAGANASFEIKVINGETVLQPAPTRIKVTDSTQVRSILARASGNRAVAETKLNQSSSRSHSVFQLRIEGWSHSDADIGGKKDGGRTRLASSSTLSLIDLAGSERIKESGSTSGDRFNEARHINQSLSTLSTVIMSLAKGEKHIPYRNSKLTYLLQHSLGAGNSKTLMFVNVSPLEEQVNETLCSLRFASKVNACHIGVASNRGNSKTNAEPKISASVSKGAEDSLSSRGPRKQTTNRK